MKFSELPIETQTYLKKAMDIYMTIKNKKIYKTFKPSFTRGSFEYEYTQLDKKILALFMAGFLVDGKLKDTISQYDDFKLQNLYDFVSIEENEINSLSDEEYENIFNTHFRIDLSNMIDSYSNTINNLTPSVITVIISDKKNCGSKILDYFGIEYNLTHFWISEHPLFKALEKCTILDGDVTKKETLQSSTQTNRPTSFGELFVPIEDEAPSEQLQEEPKALKINDKVWDVLESIKKKFIGQETAVEGLFDNIIVNQNLATMEDVPDGQRSIIFMDGATGTGKTAITREITNQLGIPFVAASVTNYSSTGYVGGDLTDLLVELYNKANGNLELAQRGVIVLDEFDKIAYSRSGGLEMKKAVQQQLLDFLGGGKYTIRIGHGLFNSKEVEFDTSKLTFVCLGALTDLRSKKTEIRKPIGFGQEAPVEEEQEFSITPQDLTSIGLEKELVGRFNTYLHTNEYSKETLEKILRESTISPLIGFKKWIEANNKKLIIEEDVYSLIAEQAYELNTGARSLQTLMNNIRTFYIKDVLRGDSDIIYLTAETVKKANYQAIHRKGRK